MRKTLLMIALMMSFITVFTSCEGDKETNQKTKWEYKVVRIEGACDSDVNPSHTEFASKSLVVSESEINALGDKGWELVGTYTEVETEHPNFGDEKYVTGLQPNTRSASLTMIFKRPKKDSSSKKKDDK